MCGAMMPTFAQAGDVQQLVAHVRHNIRPLAYFDLPGLGPGNVHGGCADRATLLWHQPRML